MSYTRDKFEKLIHHLKSQGVSQQLYFLMDNIGQCSHMPVAQLLQRTKHLIRLQHWELLYFFPAGQEGVRAARYAS